MSSSLPKSADFFVIGGGIHGLSTALHLAQASENKKIILVDKGRPGDGASGVACGVVRNNYYQPAMRRLMAHSVGVWERYAKELTYNPVGYMQISYEAMHEDVREIYQQQKTINYPSVFIEGAEDCHKYMKNMFDDWQAKTITSVLHEKKGGFAHNTKSIMGLVKLAEDAGVEIFSNTKVTGFETDNSNSINKVETDQGMVEVGEVVIAPGPWVKNFWDMLDLPNEVDIKGKDGQIHRREMWHYWMLQEGVLDVDPSLMLTNDGQVPPVIHVDSVQPLISDTTGKLLSEDPWGIYYKPDTHFGGVQGGFAPYPLEDSNSVKIDPYGNQSKDYLVGDDFIDQWCSALALCQKRFEGLTNKYRKEPSGGLGCFTPDSFPIIDRIKDNVYLIADSNHGYKMVGVGELVADELLGETSDMLEPFRFSRYETGKLHPVSNSPFPWS